jgi:hypothetical protein
MDRMGLKMGPEQKADGNGLFHFKSASQEKN